MDEATAARRARGAGQVRPDGELCFRGGDDGVKMLTWVLSRLMLGRVGGAGPEALRRAGGTHQPPDGGFRGRSAEPPRPLHPPYPDPSSGPGTTTSTCCPTPTFTCPNF